MSDIWVTIYPEAFTVLLKDTLTRHTGCFRDQTWDLVFMRQSLTIQPAQRWIGSKVSDACSETPHKACSHSFSVPEISGMINSCGIPVETAVKLQRPYSIPHAKIHRQPWPFCASAANGTLSSWVSKLKDQWDFVGIKLLQCTLSLPAAFSPFECMSMSGLHESKTEKLLTEEELGREKGKKQRTKQGWNTARMSREQFWVEHQMGKNERHPLCENQREKGFHSLLNTAHSRGGKAVYSFSNASVSVYVCVCVWLGENKEVIER